MRQGDSPEALQVRTLFTMKARWSCLWFSLCLLVLSQMLDAQSPYTGPVGGGSPTYTGPSGGGTFGGGNGVYQGPAGGFVSAGLSASLSAAPRPRFNVPRARTARFGRVSLPTGPLPVRPVGPIPQPAAVPPAPGQNPPQAKAASTPFGLPWPHEQWENWWALQAERHMELTRSFSARSRLAEASGDSFLGELGGRFNEAPMDTARLLVVARCRPLLLPLLRDSSSLVRGEAALALGKLGGAAEAAALAPLLNDGNRFVRQMAAIALGLSATPEALGPLLGAVRDESGSDHVRGFALLALGVLGNVDALPTLVAVASREQEERLIQSCAWFALGALGGEDAARFLEGAAINPRGHAEVRAIAAGALGQALGAAAGEKLIVLLTDAETQVRRSAALALGCRENLQSAWAMRDGLVLRRSVWRESGFLSPASERALEAQIHDAEQRAQVLTRAMQLREAKVRIALCKAMDDDSDRMVRHFASASLGRIGSAEAVAALKQRFEVPGTIETSRSWLGLALASAGCRQILPALRSEVAAKSTQASHRNACMLALGLLRDEASGDMVTELATTAGDPELRAGATLALGLMNYRPALKRLRAAMSADDRLELRPALGLALAVLGDAGSLDMLETQVLNGKTSVARLEATAALQSFHTPAAMDVLLRTIADKDTSDQVRAAALHALGEVAQKDFSSPLDRLAETWNYLLSSWPITDALLR